MSEDAGRADVTVTPGEAYQHDIDRGIVVADAAQARAIAKLDVIHARLLEKWQQRSNWRTAMLVRLALVQVPHIPGLYLWGGVGRGKTYLMDLFFHTLPGSRKLRMHFHRFMLMIHRQLHEQAGHSDPLVQVAAGIAGRVDVICFDEFFVADIGDAMILGNLFEALFAAGVTLVATSNIVPDKLYEYGLQRQNFLPAIALLNQHTDVLNVDGGVDYRLRSLDKVPVYLVPLDAVSAQALHALFTDLSRGLHVETNKMLDIQQREVMALYWSEGLVWFDFETLCGGPRGAADYIEIARQYHTVFVSRVPVMESAGDDKARRFITLVDEFYDHRVVLVLSAAVEPEQLYMGKELQFAFSRTVSRLLEMQTREYLASGHNPD